MEFSGLRWRYRIRNSVVDVENAIGAAGWSQERLLVNGDALFEGGGMLRFYQTFREPWLTERGEEMLYVRMTPAVHGIRCSLRIGTELLSSDEMLVARWWGPRRSWPDEDAWR